MQTLPNPAALRRQLQSMAVLDAILSPEWEDRYYDFQSDWADAEQMAGIRNGSGDEVFFLFSQAGCFVKGYAHEFWIPELPASRHYAKVPTVFDSGVNEPAFSPDDVSFCLWWLNAEPGWHGLDTADNANEGGLFLLAGLDGFPLSYKTYAKNYFEIELRLSDVEAIYAHQPISDELLLRLNPDLELVGLREELLVIGYSS